jgi:hypothetical protein
MRIGWGRAKALPPLSLDGDETAFNQTRREAKAKQVLTYMIILHCLADEINLEPLG